MQSASDVHTIWNLMLTVARIVILDRTLASLVEMMPSTGIRRTRFHHPLATGP